MAISKKKTIGRVKKKTKKPQKVSKKTTKKKPALSAKKILSKKTLVIVESPAKAKTINKYLGKNYIIEASLGHVIDLPKSRMAIDVKENFRPEYITVRGRAPTLQRLKTLAGAVREVFMAADPDREGEAISWHLKNALEAKNPNIKRIEFNEITKSALQQSIQKPREIDQNLVNAQQARRILDRLVGYNISPILWKKIKNGLSAGRVQSVALQYVCDREKEIDEFIEEEYWSLEAQFAIGRSALKALLYSINGVRQERQIKSEKQMNGILFELQDNSYIVKTKKIKERQREATAPYTTSKFQQDASTRLGYSSQKTMIVAQKLYEGIEIGKKEGFVGLITYMRTDSNRTAPDALTHLRNYIQEEFGEKYLSEKTKIYKNKRGAQDAHEAIRPTDPRRHPDKIASFLTREQQKIYELIWQKFVSSQMAREVSIYTSIDIEAGNKIFRGTHRKIKFDGFALVYGALAKEEKESKSSVLVEIKEGTELKLKKFEPKQHFVTPPPRYSDAAMVKVLEESGVGRPSTYAPTIQTLLRRYYVTRMGRNLRPTELGLIVSGVMRKHFPHLVDPTFTARMEDELDMVASSDLNWVDLLTTFYTPFVVTLKNAAENIEDMKAALDKPTEHICEKCGTNMVKRLGRNGYFLACPRFPECRNAKSIPLGPCPLCDTGQVARRATKKGRPFYGCNRYPDCDFSSWDVPAEENCPECGKLLFQKSGRSASEKRMCLRCGYNSKISDEEANGSVGKSA